MYFILVLSSGLFAQTYSEDELKYVSQNPDSLYLWTPEKQVFNNGDIMEFLARHLKYPKSAIKNNVQGRVIVSFIIEKDGKISDVKIKESLNRECDKSAMDAIKATSGFWIPGKVMGKPVRLLMMQPFTFKL